MNLYQLVLTHLLIVSILELCYLSSFGNAKSISNWMKKNRGDEDEERPISINEPEETLQDCRRNCDTLFGVQCAQVVPNYEHYFMCTTSNRGCKEKCKLRHTISELKVKVKKLKKKVWKMKHLWWMCTSCCHRYCSFSCSRHDLVAL